MPYAKIGPRSVRCLTKLINLETKYMSSRFSGDASPASIKTRSSSSEKSMRYEKISKKSSESVNDGADEKYIPRSEDLGMRRKDSPKSSRKETNCVSETQVLKYRKRPRSHSRTEHRNFEDSAGGKKIEPIYMSPDERKNSIQTLSCHPKKASKKFSTTARRIDEFATKNLKEHVDSDQPEKYPKHPKSPSRPHSRNEHHTFEDSVRGKIIEQIFTKLDERDNSIQTVDYHPKSSSRKVSTSAQKIEEFITKNREDRVDTHTTLQYRERPKSSSRPQSRNEHLTLEDSCSGKKIEQIFASSEERENPIQPSNNHPKNSKKPSTSARKIDELSTKNSEDHAAFDQPLKNRDNPKSSSRLQRHESAKKLPASGRKSEEIGKTPEDRVNSTNETLHQVKEKLENLHSVLRIYGSPESAVRTEEVCSRKELAESILQDLKNLGDFPTESESDGKTNSCAPAPLDSNTEESQCLREETDSTSEFEQCRSDRDSSSARSYENPIELPVDRLLEKTDLMDIPKRSASENFFEKKFQDERTKISRDSKNSPEEDELSDDKNRPTESSEDDHKFMTTELEYAAQPSPTSSQTELSKDSDAEDKSNATLLREALKFKKALLAQIELGNEERILKTDDSEEKKTEESDGESDEAHWPKAKSYFPSKLLEIISEEQSASSSTEKTSKTRALANTSAETERIDENEYLTNEKSPSSKLALVSESSEYFSLSNLEEKLAAQRTVSVTRKETLASSSDLTDDEQDDRDLKKNISDLVDQSVRNIREYIEVFSQIQSDAIVEASRAMVDDDPPIVSTKLKECSSEDSIMHFVNTVAMSDSVCEQLPRKLSEPLINSLLDFSDEEFLCSPESSDCKPDFTLKRRPGSTSLAEQADEKSCDRHDARSLFESAHSEIGDDDRSGHGALSSEPSCKELLMDYSLESDSDLTDDKLSATLNLIVFEEENEPRARDEFDERTRTVDSPLTGRTVIRAVASSTSNIRDSAIDIVDSNGLSQKKNELLDVEEFMDFGMNRDKSEANDVPETSSVYFTDDVASSERKIDKPEVVEESIDNVSESSTWILDNPEKSFNQDREEIEVGASGELKKSVEKNEIEVVEDKRPVSGETIVRGEIEGEEEVSSRVNLSSDTSGTYMDASSRDYLNSSGVSLAFDKSILDQSPKRIEIAVASKSARGSSSSPLQQRVPWNAPRRGSSLNNASSVRSKKSERSSPGLDKSTENSSTAKSREKSSIDKSKHNSSSDRSNKNLKPARSQSTSCKEIKAKSNFRLAGTKDLESSNVTTGQRSNKSGHDLPERRSRSYTTPRKSEASPRSSTTSQPPDNPRPSRTRRDLGPAKTSLESAKSENASGVLCSKPSSKSCLTRASSKSCIPILKSRLESARQTRTRSPMRGPLTMSMSSWSQEARRTTQDPQASPETNIPSEGSPDVGREDESSVVIGSKEPYETLEKIERRMERSTSKLPESRTVIYVNIVTEQEHSATRVVDPKKFLEYLKDRDLKIQSVLDQEIGVESSLTSPDEQAGCSSPRVLTVVSSAVDENAPSDGSLRARSNNSALTGSWSLRVEQREIEVSAKPSVIDTSTSISDLLPEISTDTPTGSPGKFKIFEVPKELTKDEYIVLLEALNQDPNLHQLREMHKLCNKLGLGFHE